MAVIRVSIAGIRRETPRIRVLSLDLLGQEFSFHAGQWIDCYADIDGVRHVAGYSIASSPTVKDRIELAVREGDNPVTAFIHGGAKPGDSLYIEGGQGEVYFTREMGGRLVVVAAGIGIAPMMSIVRYVHELGDVEARVVYGAGSVEELAYIDELTEIAGSNPEISLYVTVSGGGGGYRRGRVDEALLREAGVGEGDLCFVCGPPPMIRS
ncbi:FAD-dependent oxidoreductase, partial [Candidatus Bathyarchaeota archaeon]|nr:FAD-dependent oxidoreductase [Candidatus Bathyarchaeota archaeon]